MSRLKEVFSALRTFATIYSEADGIILMNQFAFVADYFKNDMECIRDYLKYMFGRLPKEIHNIAYNAHYVVISNIDYESVNIRFMDTVGKYMIAFKIPSKYKKLKNDIFDVDSIITNVLAIIDESDEVILGGGPDINKKTNRNNSFTFYKKKYDTLIDSTVVELNQNFYCSDEQGTMEAAAKIMAHRLTKDELKEYILTRFYYGNTKLIEGTYIMDVASGDSRLFLSGDKDDCATVLQAYSYEGVVFELWIKDYYTEDATKILRSGECSDKLLDMVQIMCVRNYYSPRSLFLYQGIACDYEVENKKVVTSSGLNSWYTIEYNGDAYIMESRGTNTNKFSTVVINLPGAKQIDEFDCDFCTVRELKTKFNLGKALYNLSSNSRYDSLYRGLGVNILH